MAHPDVSPRLALVRECLIFARRWRALVDERLKATGITMSRATVLYWISTLPDRATQRMLADVVGIEGPTLVRQLHALEQKGLIKRVEIPGDRRANSIALTEAAQPVLEMVMRTTEALTLEQFGHLDEDELKAATAIIMQARETLE